ncbi:MAG: carboxypeptidase regulatory-like domain-containing protein [Terriglobia bacterium]
MYRRILKMGNNAADRPSGRLAKRKKRQIVLLVAIALTCGLGNRALFGQTPTATLTGLVQDQSGAVVQGANLTLTNTGTGIPRTTKSGSDGYYTFSILLPGTYELTVEDAGFETLAHKDIRLDVQETVRLNLTLQVGVASQAVTVTASVPLLQQETSSLSQLVAQSTVAELPLLGRNPYALVQLAPGVFMPASYNALPVDIISQSYVSINGARAGQNEYLLDGVPNTSPGNSGPVVTPSVEAVQEYRVVTNNYAAEYGRAAGGIFNVATKYGTNTLHGDAYDYVRNTLLDSNDFFSNRAGLPVDAFHFNQFGATLGGAIRKNKTFFFGSYEGTRQVQGDTFVGTVPTALQEEGNFSQTYNSKDQLITIYNPFGTSLSSSTGNYTRTAFPGNIIPTGSGGLINPASQGLLQLFPSPNTPGTPYTEANNFTSADPYRVRKDDFSVRVDHELSNRQRVFTEVLYDRTPRVFPSVYGDAGSPTYGGQIFQRRGAVLSDTYAINPTTILSFEYGFNRMTNVRYPFANGYNLSQLGFSSSFASGLSPESIPAMTIAGLGGSALVTNTNNGSEALGDTTLILFGVDSHTWQASVSKSAGRHTWKFGGDFNLMRQNAQQNSGTNGFSFTSAFTQGPVATSASSTAGNAFASFLLGTASSGSVTAAPALALQSIDYGFYGQDDIKITPKLTLNLGLRYEYQAPWTDRFNRLTNFNFQAVPPLTATGLNLHGALSFVGVDGNPRGQWNPSRDNVAPRAGFAYSLDQKTVIRGGAGLFYAPGFTSTNWTSTTGFASTSTFVGSLNGVTPYNLLNNPFPSGLVPAIGSSQGFATDLGQSITFTDRNFKVPTSGAWNLQIQRELPAGALATIAYVGDRGWHEYQALQFNQLPDSDLAQGSALLALVPNPFYGQITSGALSASKVSQEQLDLPYPQFQSLATNYSTWASSGYNALQITAEKRFSHGVSVNASYAWSKLMDNNTGDFNGQTLGAAGYQDYYNLRSEWGVSALDVPRRLVVAYRWELPAGSGRRFFQSGPAAKVLGGWQVEGITAVQTGETLGIGDATNTSDSTNAAGQRPNWNGTNPARSNPTVNEWFNTSVFSQPAAFTFGNAPRSFGSLHASPLRNFDFSGIKNTQLAERFSLQFRAEFLNLFNTPQFNPPATSFGAGTFGTVSGQQNNARIVQLALKLIF